MSEDSDEIVDALSTLFLAAARSVGDRLVALGQPLTAEKRRYWIERRENGWGLETGEGSHNSLKDWSIVYSGWPWLLDADFAAVRACADLIVRRFSATLPFAVAPGRDIPLLDRPHGERAIRPEFANDSSGWVARYLVHPALYFHLAALPSVVDASAASALAFANDVIGVAADLSLNYVTQVPLIGLDIEPVDTTELRVGEVWCRRLSPEQQAEWSNDYPEGRLARVSGSTAPPDVLLEIHMEGPRNEWFSPPRERALRLVAAFHLHGIVVAGTVVAEEGRPPWLHWGRWSSPIDVPRITPTRSSLGIEELRQVVVTAKGLEAVDLRHPRSSKDLAFHRFVLGMTRTSDTDAVLDFTIALEALLLPYDRHARQGDLSYRFRVHGARYMASSMTDLKPIFEQLGNIYKMRSRLVHGGKYPSLWRNQGSARPCV